mmetsp:Transcript_6968/g.12283  ORF Transcript_6968/g.12283 Transcript_6968/m.12283 type:complete len:85 (-) Transcript_6968:229-483(-)
MSERGPVTSRSGSQLINGNPSSFSSPLRQRVFEHTRPFMRTDAGLSDPPKFDPESSTDELSSAFANPMFRNKDPGRECVTTGSS